MYVFLIIQWYIITVRVKFHPRYKMCKVKTVPQSATSKVKSHWMKTVTQSLRQQEGDLHFFFDNLMDCKRILVDEISSLQVM